MSNNIPVPKEVFENVVAVLRMYAESKWGWDGEDNSVVRSWGEVYPEPKGFHFKAGGDMAKIALGELQRLLTQRALDAANVCRVINHFYVEGVCSQCGSQEPPRQ